jgi:acyl-CoA dehydrogenase
MYPNVLLCINGAWTGAADGRTIPVIGRVADRAVQIHGGAGYVADHGIERYYRDVRSFRIYERTSQIQQLVIARNMIREAS